MAIDRRNVETDMFDTMWAFLQMGSQKSNYPLLREYCLALRKLMTQKTAGQTRYKKRGNLPFENLERIKNGIVIEAMALVLSGELDAFYRQEVPTDE